MVKKFDLKSNNNQYYYSSSPPDPFPSPLSISSSNSILTSHSSFHSIDNDSESESENNEITGLVSEKPKNITFSPSKRIISIDIFRGLTISFMIFNSYNYWGSPLLRHVSWDGIHLADLELPIFLFIMGASLSISLEFCQRCGNFCSEQFCPSGCVRPSIFSIKIIYRLFKRLLILILLNLFFNANLMPLSQTWDITHIRIPGVLFRLGICYFVVYFLLLLIPKLRQPDESKSSFWSPVRELSLQWLFIFILCLIPYIYLTYYLKFPCDNEIIQGYIGPGGNANEGKYRFCTGGSQGYLDRIIFGSTHIWADHPCVSDISIQCPFSFDDNGFVGTFTSIITMMYGVFCGYIILFFQNKTNGKRNIFLHLLIWSLLSVTLASLLCSGCIFFNPHHHLGWIPINKSLWSPSFVAYTASISMILLLIIYFLSNMLPYSILTDYCPLFWIGRNSLLNFILSISCYRWLFWLFPAFWGIKVFSSFQLIIVSLVGVLFWWLFSLWLYIHRWFFVA